MRWIRFGAPLGLLIALALIAFIGSWEAFIVATIVCVAGYLIAGGKKALDDDAAFAARFSLENALRAANGGKKEPQAPAEKNAKKEPQKPQPDPDLANDAKRDKS